MDDLAEKLNGEVTIANKGYVSKEFTKEMKKRGVIFIAIKRGKYDKNEAECYSLNLERKSKS